MKRLGDKDEAPIMVIMMKINYVRILCLRIVLSENQEKLEMKISNPPSFLVGLPGGMNENEHIWIR